MFTALVGTTHNGNFSANTEKNFEDNEFMAADLWADQQLDATDSDTVQYEHVDGHKAMNAIIKAHEAWKYDIDSDIAMMQVQHLLDEDEAIFARRQEILERSIYA